MRRDGLLKRGCHQRKTDLYSFYKNDSIIVMHVDNCVVFAKDSKKVHKIIKSLESNFKLTDEGDLIACLGIDITKNDGGSWTLSQPYLIEKIMKALNLHDESKTHDKPATEALTSDKDVNVFNEK